MEMIDVKLVKKSPPASNAIANIDRSWRQYLEAIRANTFRLPFSGKYSAVVEREVILIEGYNGKLVIDRVTGDRNTYALTKPISCHPFKIYGVWDAKANFSYFTSKPILGFHYLGLQDNGLRQICTGEMEYSAPDDFDSLKGISEKMITSWRIIYLESLGEVFVPSEFDRLKEIAKSNKTTRDKISVLLAEGWIREIL